MVNPPPSTDFFYLFVEQIVSVNEPLYGLGRHFCTYRRLMITYLLACDDDWSLCEARQNLRRSSLAETDKLGKSMLNIYQRVFYVTMYVY